MTKISVVMPVYNTKEDHLRAAIESTLSQTYTDFEFIILNDGSTNKNVDSVIKSYQDSRIVYLQNEKNLGISLSRNKLIDLAKGQYLAVMDHDDISLPERFAKQVEFLDSNPKVGVVGCWYERFPKKKIIKKPINNKDIVETLLFSCCILHPSSMIRKSVLIDNNLRYENQYSPSEDYALWCRLISKTEFANLPEVLFKYRDCGCNTTHTQAKKMSNATSAIFNFVRKEHAQLWEDVKSRSTTVTRVRLFGFLPFLTIKEQGCKRLCYLFGIVPLYSIRSKRI